jgi:hypothetical protein
MQRHYLAWIPFLINVRLGVLPPTRLIRDETASILHPPYHTSQHKDGPKVSLLLCVFDPSTNKVRLNDLV